MDQGSRFNFDDVVRHFPGRDASHCVPLKASANGREKLAITVAQCQWT